VGPGALLAAAAVLAQPPQDYPPAARAAGHQGEVAVTGLVGADGRLADAQVERSSRSAWLDRAALAYFRSWTFRPATDGEGLVRATVAYWKDSFDDPRRDVEKKTCGDFVVDADWFAAAFPERRRTDMHLYQLTFSMMAYAQSKGDLARFAAAGAGLPAAFDQAYADCRAHPRARFLDTYRRRAIR
jgi:TonB family protein